jgi:hypothetical protein
LPTIIGEESVKYFEFGIAEIWRRISIERQDTIKRHDDAAKDAAQKRLVEKSRWGC